MSFILALGVEKIGHAINEKRNLKNAVLASPDDPISCEDLCNRLKTNQLSSIRIGYAESDFLQSLRAAKDLEKALKANTSVRVIRVGWKHRNKATLFHFLRAIGSHCVVQDTTATTTARMTTVMYNNMLHSSMNHSNPNCNNSATTGRLQEFQLILNNHDWVEERVLLHLLEHQRNLTTLYLQSVQVVRKSPLTGKFCCSNVPIQRHVSKRIRHNKVSSTSCDNNSSSTTSPTTSRTTSPHSSLDTTATIVTDSDRNDDCCRNTMVPLCDHSVVTRILLPSLQNLAHLKVLNLVDCGIDDRVAEHLATFMQAHYQYHSLREEAATAFLDDQNKKRVLLSNDRAGVTTLSLRSNRELDVAGLKAVVDGTSATLLQRLDLSLCDFTSVHAFAIARALAERTAPLQELLLCGNYRMETTGLAALLQPDCCANLGSLDISHCDIRDYGASIIFQTLRATFDRTNNPKAKNARPSRLQRLVMKGSRVATTRSVNALRQLLMQPTTDHYMSLRVLQFKDPLHPNYMTDHHLRMLLPALEKNYDLEVLDVDMMNTRENCKAWEDLEFYLALNRAGRRIIRTQSSSSSLSKGTASSHKRSLMHLLYGASPATAVHDAAIAPQSNIFDVFSKAGQHDNLNVTYWIVRECSDWFGQLRKQARA